MIDSLLRDRLEELRGAPVPKRIRPGQMSSADLDRRIIHDLREAGKAATKKKKGLDKLEKMEVDAYRPPHWSKDTGPEPMDADTVDMADFVARRPNRKRTGNDGDAAAGKKGRTRPPWAPVAARGKRDRAGDDGDDDVVEAGAKSRRKWARPYSVKRDREDDDEELPPHKRARQGGRVRAEWKPEHKYGKRWRDVDGYSDDDYDDDEGAKRSNARGVKRGREGDYTDGYNGQPGRKRFHYDRKRPHGHGGHPLAGKLSRYEEEESDGSDDLSPM